MPLTLYRKRLIPNETVLLKNDRILFTNSNSLITGWTTLKPKPTLAFGYSLYLFNQGFKISRFYGPDNNFLFWYCDIIDTSYNKKTNSYVFTDLLADVVVETNGICRILDLDELSDAFSQRLLSEQQLTQSLKQLHNLLQIIYNGKFDELAQPLLDAEQKDRKM